MRCCQWSAKHHRETTGSERNPPQWQGCGAVGEIRHQCVLHRQGCSKHSFYVDRCSLLFIFVIPLLIFQFDELFSVIPVKFETKTTHFMFMLTYEICTPLYTSSFNWEWNLSLVTNCSLLHIYGFLHLYKLQLWKCWSN